MRYYFLAILCLAVGVVGGYWQCRDHMAGEMMQAKGDAAIFKSSLAHQMKCHGILMADYNALADELEKVQGQLDAAKVDATAARTALFEVAWKRVDAEKRRTDAECDLEKAKARIAELETALWILGGQ